MGKHRKTQLAGARVPQLGVEVVDNEGARRPGAELDEARRRLVGAMCSLPPALLLDPHPRLPMVGGDGPPHHHVQDLGGRGRWRPQTLRSPEPAGRTHRVVSLGELLVHELLSHRILDVAGGGQRAQLALQRDQIAAVGGVGRCDRIGDGWGAERVADGPVALKLGLKVRETTRAS
ncbi:MAG: hypothetical protein M3360_08470 [Actinomycetota bacterium]|nr:hypothetical protein [Actinomycetota bacterium]